MAWEYLLIIVYIAFLLFLEAGAPIFSISSTTLVRASASLFNSLSIMDIIHLANSSEDRSDVIKEFYDWKQKNFLFIIKGFAVLIVVNGGAIVKKGFMLQGFAQLPGIYWELAYCTGFLLGITSILIYRLRRIPSEYLDAMLVYNALKK
jgi:hypothetical protein